MLVSKIRRNLPELLMFISDFCRRRRTAAPARPPPPPPPAIRRQSARPGGTGGAPSPTSPRTPRRLGSSPSQGVRSAESQVADADAEAEAYARARTERLTAAVAALRQGATPPRPQPQ